MSEAAWKKIGEKAKTDKADKNVESWSKQQSEKIQSNNRKRHVTPEKYPLASPILGSKAKTIVDFSSPY